MANIAAELQLEATLPYGQGVQPFTIQVCVPERAEMDWTCTVIFSGFVNKSRRAFGVDSWQALKLGLSIAHTELATCGATLLHLGESVSVNSLFVVSPAE